MNVHSDEELGSIWKALSDPTRRRILDYLKEQPRTTGELSALFSDLSRFAVMKHLGILEEAGLVVVRRSGRERWNHLNAVPLQRIYERWLRPFEDRWANTLINLQKHIEQTKGVETMNEAITAMPTVGLMQIEQEIFIAAEPARVYKAITEEISAWWGAPYLLSDTEAKRIELEARAGGRLYEDWGNGGSALWGTVTGIDPGRLLKISGTMGMDGAGYGNMTYELEPRDNGTLLKFSHHAIGEISEGTQQAYSEGWDDLLNTRLKAFVECGERMGLDKGA